MRVCSIDLSRNDVVIATVQTQCRSHKAFEGLYICKVGPIVVAIRGVKR